MDVVKGTDVKSLKDNHPPRWWRHHSYISTGPSPDELRKTADQDPRIFFMQHNAATVFKLYRIEVFHRVWDHRMEIIHLTWGLSDHDGSIIWLCLFTEVWWGPTHLGAPTILFTSLSASTPTWTPKDSQKVGAVQVKYMGLSSHLDYKWSLYFEFNGYGLATHGSRTEKGRGSTGIQCCQRSRPFSKLSLDVCEWKRWSSILYDYLSLILYLFIPCSAVMNLLSSLWQCTWVGQLPSSSAVICLSVDGMGAKGRLRWAFSLCPFTRSNLFWSTG